MRKVGNDPNVPRLRGDMVLETKATLKVVRTRIKYMFLYTQRKRMQSKSICSYILKDTECNPLFVTMDKFASIVSKGTICCSYVSVDGQSLDEDEDASATALSTTNYRVHP